MPASVFRKKKSTNLSFKLGHVILTCHVVLESCYFFKSIFSMKSILIHVLSTYVTYITGKEADDNRVHKNDKTHMCFDTK